MTKVVEDGFVRHPDLGLGWFDAAGATLRFFDSPAIPDRVVPLLGHDVRRATLEKGQRVWWHDGTRWLVGRVDSPGLDGAIHYFVHFPNGRTELLPSQNLRVRWQQPVTDPVSLLQAGAVETRYFHTRRSAFLRSVTEQRAAGDGLGGVVSSAVDLHAHQLGAARRVLLDPVRRYLLADEVGLGKTIEAGMVLRQVLLDEPGEALVLVPASLVGQWEDELSTKFRVDQFGSRVTVRPHGDLINLPDDSRLMVIVDEAHRLTENAHGHEDAGRSYSQLCKIACAASSILLLSATPVRSNEDAFLRLLHLLDPATYPLSDLGAFRTRVAIRDDLAECIAAIEDETPLAYLAEPATQLLGMLPVDQLLTGLVDWLVSAVDRSDEHGARAASRQLREHVSETYRIHRRMIRTRRTPSLLRSFPVRGRERDAQWALDDPDPRRPRVLALVDGLRVRLSGRDEDQACDILRALLGRSLAPTSALRDIAMFLHGETKHDLSADEQEVFARLEALGEADGLASSLDDLLGTDVDQDRHDAAIAWVKPHVDRRQVAVVCSFTNSAIEFAERLETALGAHRVARVFLSSAESERIHAVRDFNSNPDRTVIVLDRVGEEGLNLQTVDAVLHLDLPTTISRLEQRLGRFDRWAGLTAGQASKPVRSAVFAEVVEAVDDHLGAWRRVLDQGVGIFEKSTATIQYVLPDLEEAFFTNALDAGLREAGNEFVAARKELDLQARRIAGQDVLDAIEDRSDDERYLAQLESVDSRHRLITEAFKGYACDMLGFTAIKTPKGVRFGVSAKHPPLLTESAVMALGPERLRISYEAARGKVQPGAGFLRWGEPLVNSFMDLVLDDDRGRAFIVELPEKGLSWDADPQFLFCFDVVVEPGVEPVRDLRAEDSSAAGAVAGQLLRFLTPRIERVWLMPGRGEPPEQVIKQLEVREGINLGSRPDRLEELTRGRNWSRQCEEQAQAALRLVANRVTVRDRLADALTSALRSQERERTIAAARVRVGGDHSIDERLLATVIAALKEPRIDIDSCGVVIVTPHSSAQ